MKLITQVSSSRHEDFATCVGWISSDEAVSVGDDSILIHWKNGKEVKRSQLHQSFHAICLHCAKIRSSSSETLLFGTSDGRLHLYSTRSGRVEKSVDGHEGAVLSVKWSADASAIASGGEDGLVKVWSKGLLLRSTLSAQSSPIYAIDWSTSSSGLNSLSFVSQGMIHIKPITPHSKALSWRGHEGIILALAWGPLIATAGEDKKYKLWDSRGRLIYSSSIHEYPLTCISWCNEAILLGSFNLLKLLMKDGQATSSEYLPGVHSLMNVSPSPDNTSIIAATTSGRIVFANVSSRRIQTVTHDITSINSNRLIIHSTVNSADQHELDTSPGNIITFTASFGHVIVISSKPSGFIYKLSTKGEYKFDVKSCNVSCILQNDRSFAIVDASTSSLSLFTYDGKLITPNIKWLGAPSYESMIDINLLSLSSDFLAAVDSIDTRVIHWIALTPGGGKNASSVSGGRGNCQTIHSLEVTTVALSCRQARMCAYIDVNGDLYLVKVNTDRSIKLASAIESIRWSESNNLLAGISQSKQLLLWLSPSVAFNDTDLTNECMMIIDTVQQDSLSLAVFSETTIIILAGLIHLTYKINPICVLLDDYCRENNLNKAVNLCRLVLSDDNHSRPLWASLAGAALQSHQLDIAEIAYNQLDSVHRVVYLHQIQQITDNNARNGELALLAGEIEQAENIFLQASYILRVIILRLTLFKWDSALELALKYKDKHPEYVKLVLWKRASYLHQLQLNEEKKIFLDNQDEMDDDDEIADQVTQMQQNIYSKL